MPLARARPGEVLTLKLPDRFDSVRIRAGDGPVVELGPVETFSWRVTTLGTYYVYLDVHLATETSRHDASYGLRLRVAGNSSRAHVPD